MAPLTQTNPYLRDPEKRMKMLVRNAIDSCTFEGAQGLRTVRKTNQDNPRRNASTKKSVKGS